MKCLVAFLTILVICFGCDKPADLQHDNSKRVIHELNEKEISKGSHLIALVGGLLVDGRGGAPVANSCVIIDHDRISAVGKREDIDIPSNAEVVDATGLTVVPGLIDAHYHNEDSDVLALLYLRHGVTSVRDPGEWIASYDALRAMHKPIPRLFLAGPHLDTYPPAYPLDSYIVKDPEEARLAVDRLAHRGATVIKVYFGLPVGFIRTICETAHGYGLPVTAHLEVTNAMDAISAGLDGVEHITSFGTCLLPMQEAEAYKQKVLGDRNARRRGRYEVWSSLDVDNSPAADSLVRFLVDKKVFVSPTLAVFERRADKGDSVEVMGFKNMIAFVGKANDAGVRFVVGSHSYVPYAELGFAYQREMELLHEAGLSNMEVIQAATLENARFFRVDERLGSIEAGKIADLVLVQGNPLDNISAMRNVKNVMLNGVWVGEESN